MCATQDALARRPGQLIFLHVLWCGISDAILVDGEHAVTLGKAGTVVDLGNPSLATALFQTQTSRAGMGDDVATYRLLRIRVEHGTRSSVDLRDDLIGDDDGDAELVC